MAHTRLIRRKGSQTSKSFSSKLMKWTQRGGLWTFSANLALCVAHWHFGPKFLTFHYSPRDWKEYQKKRNGIENLNLFDWSPESFNLKVIVFKSITVNAWLKYGSEKKGSSLCRCSILLGFIMSKNLRGLWFYLLIKVENTTSLVFLT